MNLNGAYTALITPFNSREVDHALIRDLVNEQLDSGIDGLVPVGTTGESPTLSFDEHKKVIETVVDVVAGRCNVVAGTGGNSTAEALELTRFAKEVGADASLQVTPYYNKPTQEGLYRHFSTIADEVDLPIVLYNIPGRTVVEIQFSTILRLARHENIVAIKEATGNVDNASRILASCDLQVLSGDDSLTLPMMAVGATGVISVASNLIPREIAEMTRLALDGDIVGARSIHFRFYPLFSVLFVETNPIPVKAALAAMGRINEEYRLPLCPLSAENREELVEVLRQTGVLR